MPQNNTRRFGAITAGTVFPAAANSSSFDGLRMYRLPFNHVLEFTNLNYEIRQGVRSRLLSLADRPVTPTRPFTLNFPRPLG